MKTLNKLGLLCSLIGIFAFAAPVSAGDQFSDEWKIGVSGDAATAGSISFTLSFEQGNGMARDPITIDTSVAANTSVEGIVSAISDAFSTALGEDDFDVEISWGEQVKVEAEGNTPKFALAISRNTLHGIGFKIIDN
jgi:hypothetical protein